MKVYEQLASLLQAHGVDTVFGLMGDANMYLTSAFELDGGRFVRAVHEAGALSMADVYARMTGRPGVATVTHGPGFTNTLTALVEAARFPAPILLITGDPPAEATHLQRLDIGAVCASLGVAHERIHRPDTVVRDFARALRRLRGSGAPVVLNVPLPISVAESASEGQVAEPVWPTQIAPVTGGALDQALGLVAASSRPIVLAGRGVVAAAAEAELVALADLLGAPLFTTGLARGLFRDHPRHLGIMGSLSHEGASQILNDSDCVLAFGAALNKYTTLGGELFQDKRLLQVDVDPSKLGWLVQPDESIVGDARAVAATMTAELRAGGFSGSDSWRARSVEAAAMIRTWTPADQRSGPRTVDIRVVSQRLNQALPVDCTIVSDVGRFVAGVWPYLDRCRPGRFTAMTGFGSIGLGVAAGIGAAVAGVSELTVALVGDGGFMMHASELATAARERLPLLVLVFNDGAYGAEYHKLTALGFDPRHAYNDWPDLSAVASAAGAEAHLVTQLEDVDVLAKRVASLEAPLVVDIRLDPTHHLSF
ncbi:thiamine pyrophosphate-binding protein [Saccharopolyspora phatthalungensis]|uniref:Thiamine pyrophosphate-dependent acetolactate synthase large subunit-like protein n=1 Tax=Saccharopolyspora phatthalungensis TaxID=664693 RepID=A0A840QIS5_9PSEU|nr:thiamine pyrophosphate-binding protein [Saccharopolyspora phatthalungensis]MBB5157343.1 thiamine pyrophosphate-dependent acetolactate synthase large subunit-like protein [Saccharopolyspora phatthalungensis]